VTRIDPDGQQTFLGGLGGEPNGLAMADDGSIIVANVGTGAIQKLHPDGHSEEFLTEVDGVKLTSANYVLLDTLYLLKLFFLCVPDSGSTTITWWLVFCFSLRLVL
jgi:gluconolactonase